MNGSPDVDGRTLLKSGEYIKMLGGTPCDCACASATILELARIPNNLGDLAQNGKCYVCFPKFQSCSSQPFVFTTEALLHALVNALDEHWQSDITVSTNILYTFFCMSAYSRFHGILRKLKVSRVDS